MDNSQCKEYAEKELLLLQNILAYITSSAEDIADIKSKLDPGPETQPPEETPKNEEEWNKKVNEILSGSGSSGSGHEFKSTGWRDPKTGKLYEGELARRIMAKLSEDEKFKASSNGISNQNYDFASNPEIATAQNLKALIDILSHIEFVLCGSNINITKYL